MYIFLFFMIVGFLVITSTIVMTIWFKTNRILNFYIITTSLVLCFYLITYGFNNCELIGGWKLWSLNYYQVVLILTPAVYLFFEKLIINSKYPDKKDFVYFIVPLLFCYYLGTRKFQDSLFEMGIIFSSFVIYTVFFCQKTYRLIKPYLWNEYYDIDVLSPIVKNWANFIFRMTVLVKVHFFVFFLSKFFQIGIIYNLILESSLLVVFLIGYFKVAFSPSLFYGTPKLEKITNVFTSDSFVNKVWTFEPNKRINSYREIKVLGRIQDKIPIYIQQIENIAIVNHCFRKRDYSVTQLSLEMGVPKYYLEFLFKYYCKVSFNDYKKIIRISDAVNLINEGYLASNTLDSLSRHVGFASYNPFLINFKEIVGISPFDYYKRKFVVLNKNG